MKNPVREVIDSYVSHDYPTEVDNEFRAWLTSPSHADEKDRELSRLWENSDYTAGQNFKRSYEQMRGLTGIADRARLKKLQARLRIWRVAAAIITVVVMATGALLLPMSGPKLQPDLLQAYIPKAEMQTVTLPDGTIAMLNANSTLLYPEQFNGDTRSVFLSGEANFKVKPDPEHPFIVKTADFQVTALGTEFNVSAYPEEDLITATLLSGKVRIEYDNLTRSEILNPNSQLVYSRSKRTATTAEADIADVTAWQRGEIVMRGMTADEIFTRLGRKYPYTFIYSPHSLKSDRYTLTFGADAPLHEVMGIISKVMGDINFTIEEDRCYIKASR